MIDKSLARRERVARASGPGEGYHKYFVNVLFILYPSPAASRHPLPSGEGFARNIQFPDSFPCLRKASLLTIPNTIEDNL